jgi:hypothetical protein
MQLAFKGIGSLEVSTCGGNLAGPIQCECEYQWRRKQAGEL